MALTKEQSERNHIVVVWLDSEFINISVLSVINRGGYMNVRGRLIKAGLPCQLAQ